VAEQKNPSTARAPPAAPAKKQKAERGFGSTDSKKKKSGGDAMRAQMEAQRSSAQALITHREMTDFLAHQLPAGASLQLLSDQSVFIANSIREVKENAFFGGLI